MRAYRIQDIRGFMKKLLIGEVFDTFLLSEASITTFATFRIDGAFRPEYFGSAEAELLEVERCGYALWRRVRPFFFELTKGKNTPLSFRVVFRLAPHNVAALLEKSGASSRAEEVDGLFLNLHYDGSELVCTSGAALRAFPPDRALEHAWDDMLERFFRREEIPFL